MIETSVEVYNFTVDILHTYTVGQSGVVTHNTDACWPTTLTKGKNFRDHYKDHRHLLEKFLGKKYPKIKIDEGDEFLADIERLINDGTTFNYEGLGTVKKDTPPIHVFRNDQLTITIWENGDWHTLLQRGSGMDLSIRMLPLPN